MLYIVRYKLLICFVWLVSYYSYCQPITFQKIYYGNLTEVIDQEYSFIEDNNQGYIFGNYGRLVKIDKFGNLNWMLRFESGSWVESFNNIVKHNDGGYFAEGGGVLMKLDSSFLISWTKDLIFSFPFSGAFRTINKSLDSKFIISGVYIQNGIENPMLLKVDEFGSVEWAKVYIFNHSFYSSGSLALSSDSGFVLCGSSLSLTSSNRTDIIILKLDSNGNIVWSNRYGSQNGSSLCYHISNESDSTFILTGSIGTKYFLLKINSQGNIYWKKVYSFGIICNAYWVEETNDSNFVVTGMAQGVDSFGGYQTPYLLKTDSGGNVLWFRLYRGYTENFSGCVHQTSDYGFAISSRTPAPGSIGSYSFGFIKTDSLGFSVGCNVESPLVNDSIVNDTLIYEPVIDSIINIVLNPIVYSPPTIGTEFTICTSVGIEESENGKDLSIFPNPSKGKFAVVTGLNSKGSIEIFDMNGKLIDHFNFDNEKQIEVDISSKCTPGIYFVKFISEDAVKTQKIVITDY